MREKLSKGWQQLNRCQACYYHTMHMSDRLKMSRPDTVEHNSWFLYSYRAPVIAMFSHRSNLLDNTNWHIYVNVDYWQHSNTTRQHVSKFLLRVVGSPVWYHELKEVVTQIQKSAFRDAICPNHHNVHVFVVSDEKMRQVFESHAPYCNCRY